MSRPQDKNLRPFNTLSEEEAFAIRSAGGKASGESKRQKKAMAELLELYSTLPITNKKVAKQLRNMGVPEELLTQQFQIVHAIMKGSQAGNHHLVKIYLEALGENRPQAVVKDNNLLEAILAATAGEVDVSDIPELQHPTAADPDVVE